MKDSEKAQATRWMDGELRDDEIKDLLEAQPELRADREDAERIGQMMREELTSPDEDVPYADFFNHRVQKRIEEDEYTLSERETRDAFPILMRTKKLAGIAALVLFVGWMGVITGWFGLDQSTDLTRIVEVYTPNPAHDSSLRVHAREGTAVLKLEGLETIPESQRIAGFHGGPDQIWQPLSPWSTIAMVGQWSASSAFYQ